MNLDLRLSCGVFPGLILRLTILVAVSCLLPHQSLRGCTTAVISGRVTVDGRPLLWKNRDTWQRQNEVAIDEAGQYRYVGIVNAEATKRVWMGSNEVGFCIENSLSKDLRVKDSEGMSNGKLIRKALQTCRTVADFEKLLVDTNESGRTTNGNFGVIDAEGGAMLFEVSAKSYQRYDANDPEQAPNGMIIRANFSETGSGLDSKDLTSASDLYSVKRFCRARDLLQAASNGNALDLSFVLQELSRDLGGEEALCQSRIDTSRTLNRRTTVSAVLFQGVRPNEPPNQTIMWAMLGEPRFTVAVPCWADQPEVALEVNGDGASRLCRLSTQLRSFHYDRTSTFLSTKFLPEIESALLPGERRSIEQVVKLRDQSQDPRSKSKVHHGAAVAAVKSLEALVAAHQRASKPSTSREVVPLGIDFRFDDPDGTRLGDVVNAVGDEQWDGGFAKTSTHEGSLRVRRNDSTPANRYVKLMPAVRSGLGRDEVGSGWLVMEVAGWNLSGKTENEVIRFGFSSRPDEDTHTAALILKRSAGKVRISGKTFGEGGTAIETDFTLPTTQTKSISFAIQLDKVEGNSGEGDVGGQYRLYVKTDESGFRQVGTTGLVRRLRNGNAAILRAAGFFGGKGECFDVDRFYFTRSIE